MGSPWTNEHPRRTTSASAATTVGLPTSNQSGSRPCAPRRGAGWTVSGHRQTARQRPRCKDRAAAANYLTTAADINVIVTDDGLQHYRLARDVEFVVIDAERGLGNGHLLPAGPLREPSARLTQVNLVFVNGGDDRLSGHAFELVPGNARQLNGAESAELSAFRGRQVWAVAGIGNPDRFYRLLNLNGIEAHPVPVADHGTVDLERLRNEQGWPILMTEKDAVKYPQTAVSDAWWVPVQLDITTEAQAAVKQQLQGLLAR